MDIYAEEKIEFKVTYDGNFWYNKGRSAKEILIGTSFLWGKKQWLIPAIYTCSKGLIVDFCMEVEPKTLKQFMEKWNLFRQDVNIYEEYTKEQQEQIQREHPLNIDVTPKVTLNGKELQGDSGCSISWIPPECLEEGVRTETDAKVVLEHYGLDTSKAWSIHRHTFLWNTKRIPKINSLSVMMERRPVFIPALSFKAPKVGDVFTCKHPTTFEEYTIKIYEYEQQKLEQRNFGNSEEMEYPTHCTAMAYTISPEISGLNFIVQDVAEGDSPRLKAPNEDICGPIAVFATVGIIGRANTPTMLKLSNGEEKLHTACSALHFEEQQEIAWCLKFAVKQVEDIEIVFNI